MANYKNRELHHLKSSRVRVGQGVPKPNEGFDGDLALRITSDGLKLFAKYRNRWYIVGEHMQELYNPNQSGTHAPQTQIGFQSNGNFMLNRQAKLAFGSLLSRPSIIEQVPISLTNETQNLLFTVDDKKLLSLHAAGSGSFVRLPHSSGQIECKKIHITDAYGNDLGDTHIASNSADQLTITVGGESMLSFVESTTNTMESQQIAEYLIRSDTTEDPILHLKNETNDATGPTLKLSNERSGGGNVGADDDVLGTISFDGEDNGGNAQQYGLIKGSIDVATDGQESGKIAIQVATHNGSLNDGITLTGGSTTGEVDVILGKGFQSVTNVSGEVLVNSGQVKFKETSSADADVASVGQLWVKNETPNCLAFTDDAGTDIVGIGKYHYETKICNFYSSVSSTVYLPIAGYVIERTSTAGQNEFIAMIAPFNGTLEKFALRSEAAQGTGSGSMTFRVLESSDGTEVPGTQVYRKDMTGLSIADDTYTEFDLTSPGIGSYPIPITKGRIYAFAWTPAATPFDTNTTLVFKWDITS